MATFATPSDLTSDMTHRIAYALRAAGFEMVATGLSNQSCSAYVTFQGAGDDEYCIRISDHDARTYNRDGDFRIGIGSAGNDHVTVEIHARYERAVLAAIEWDDDGEPTAFETAGAEECGEDDDDAEFALWEADDDAIEKAIDSAIAFARSRKA